MHDSAVRRCALASTAAFALFVLSGCACEGSLAPGDGSVSDASLIGLQALRIEPADAVRTIDQGVPVSVEYRAIGTFDDGTERDVSSAVVWGARSIRPLGSFVGSTFRSTALYGGRARIEAAGGSVVAQTSLTLVFRQSTIVTSGTPVPADAAQRFDGPADDARAPTLVYPNDAVVLPPNLGRIEIHWLRGPAQNTLFEIAFVNELTDVRIYTRCERAAGIRDDGCMWEAAGAVWTWIARTNAGLGPLTLRIRATDDSASAVGGSATFSMRFARDELTGTIYYWTVSDGGRIMRYDFGAAPDAAERVMGPELTTSGSCVGCHAISPDGRKLVGSVGGQNSGGMILMDLESFTPVVNRSASSDHVLQFASFSPDGNELAAVYGDDDSSSGFGDLLLFDTRCMPGTMDTCGNQTGRIALGGIEASHPNWAPDGARIAFTDVGHHDTSQRPGHGAIAYVERRESTWSTPSTLVPRVDGRNRYNPAFAPDSTFLVFDESTCPGGDVGSRDCNADTDPSATIHAVPRDGGTLTPLARAQNPGVLDPDALLANTFPRFAPFVFVLDSGDLGEHRVMWLSFSSTRRYGLRETGPSSSDESARGTWIWMTAVDPDAAVSGLDPSHAAFALPFQDLDTSNHIAVWTTQSVGVAPPF